MTIPHALHEELLAAACVTPRQPPQSSSRLFTLAQVSAAVLGDLGRYMTRQEHPGHGTMADLVLSRQTCGVQFGVLVCLPGFHSVDPNAFAGATFEMGDASPESVARQLARSLRGREVTEYLDLPPVAGCACTVLRDIESGVRLRSVIAYDLNHDMAILRFDVAGA